MNNKNIDYGKIKNNLQNYIEPNIYYCCQCGKCSAGCPAVDLYDFKPHQVISLIQSNRIDEIVNSSAIWLCLECDICSNRCPENISIAAIMNYLRVSTWQKNTKKVKNISIFYKLFVRIVQFFGRSYEPGLILGLNIGTGRFLNDFDIAVDILKKRKIKVLPEFVKGRKKISKATKKYL
ncbi:MAG: 4Fe-4S dicluster domain-containing protein [Actinomycetota bacterium]|nr:4Fe-4S dicluster domain-containing protein [Actinomycetota bacterium]